MEKLEYNKMKCVNWLQDPRKFKYIRKNSVNLKELNDLLKKRISSNKLLIGYGWIESNYDYTIFYRFKSEKKHVDYKYLYTVI